MGRGGDTHEHSYTNNSSVNFGGAFDLGNVNFSNFFSGGGINYGTSIGTYSADSKSASATNSGSYETSTAQKGQGGAGGGMGFDIGASVGVGVGGGSGSGGYVDKTSTDNKLGTGAGSAEPYYTSGTGSNSYTGLIIGGIAISGIVALALLMPKKKKKG